MTEADAKEREEQTYLEQLALYTDPYRVADLPTSKLLLIFLALQDSVRHRASTGELPLKAEDDAVSMLSAEFDRRIPKVPR